MPTLSSPSKGLRADSVRNRAKILVTARDLITELGSDVSMSQIAQNSGVAVGTLYRHFPTKADLVRAVVAEHVESLGQAAEDAWERVEQGHTTPHTELMAFLTYVVETSAHNRAAKEAARAMEAEPEYAAVEIRAAQALDKLIQVGVDAGELRPDLCVADIYLLVDTAPLDHPHHARRRWLDLVEPGLTPAHPGTR